MNGYSRAEEIAMGIRGLATRRGLSHSGCGESPIFLFSAGRGSGAEELANSLSSIVALSGDSLFPPGLIDALARQLIAVGFTPSTPAVPEMPDALDDGMIDEVIRAQLRFYQQICTRVVGRAGVNGWGLLLFDVPGEYAVYLRFLFPAARFLFLRRNPDDAYRAFLAHPPAPIRHSEALAASFRQHCAELAAGFDRWHREVDGLLIDYERFGSGGAEQIEEFLGATIPDEMRALWRSSALAGAAGCLTNGSAPPETGLGETRAHESGNAKERTAFLARAADVAAVAPPVSCVVLVPIGRYIEPECEESLRALERRGYVVRRLYGCPAIDAARNILATRALDEGFEETLWVDADVVFDPDAVDRLRSHALPVCCGICAKKGVREVAAGLLPGTNEIVFGEGGGVIEILYAGTGFLHVRREVYETIHHKLSLPTCNAWSDRRAIPFFMPMIEQWGERFTYLAEDYGFCRRARQCGFKIYADTSIRLWHIGNYRYGYEDASTAVARGGTHRYHPPGA